MLDLDFYSLALSKINMILTGIHFLFSKHMYSAYLSDTLLSSRSNKSLRKRLLLPLADRWRICHRARLHCQWSRVHVPSVQT